MNKAVRLTILIVLILAPIFFYSSFNRRRKAEISSRGDKANLPKVALIFDDLGESLKELKEIYSLRIPLSISVIPGLKFSKNIAYIGSRCGFSVLIHLPLEPKKEKDYKTDKYAFIGSSLSRREVNSLLRYYLNSMHIAIGVNNHMGSSATENPQLMRVVLRAVKNKGLVFIDSRTSLKSVAYDIAKEEGLICGYNEGFLDSVDDSRAIENKLKELIAKAEKKGKIIIIAHPKGKAIEVLKRKLSVIKGKVDFITLKDYFGL